MLNRDQLKQTEQWQALNLIWKQLTQEQRKAIAPQFQLLSSFIQETLEPPRDYAAEDAAYLDALSGGGAAFAREMEQRGFNLYEAFLKLISRSTFESPDKVLFFCELKYKYREWMAEEYRDELLEILDLVWNRLLERGFVPGEGMG